MPIDTVLFDFGGVVVDWNPRHLYRQVIPDEVEMEKFLAEVWSPAENERCDRGRPYAEMIAELSDRHPGHADEIAACAPDQRWIETIAGPIDGALELLDELRGLGVHLYGLSNWSAETFPAARARYECFDRFDDIVISGEQDGIAKPDREMFAILERRHGFTPEQAVFVDDSPRNTEAAAGYGYSVVTFTNTPDLRRQLRRLGIDVADDEVRAHR
ncbi:MAG TPA: HAD family phosphatase [Microthrixaceae bacterium]|nr:HAD family phosphatase [Microthrixaceae bacterium]